MRAQGVCFRCGTFANVEATPGAVGIAESVGGPIRGECEPCRTERLAPPCYCGHPKARHGRYGCDSGLCRCQDYRRFR